MANKCLFCGKEVEGRAGAKYCNDAHRMAYKRKGTPEVKEKTEARPLTPEETDLARYGEYEVEVIDFTLMPYKELQSRINEYPQDSWVESPEFKELNRRLDTMTLEELKAERYYIPAWKLSGQPNPRSAESNHVVT